MPETAPTQKDQPAEPALRFGTFLGVYTPSVLTILGDALEWLAAMCSNVPNKGEQMVRYYGHYSNVARGKRKKQDQDGLIPSILEPVEDPDFSGGGSSKEFRKNWARLTQKIYEVDPLACPKCFGKMEIISMIEDEEVIKKGLKHLGLWDRKARPPPKATGPPKIPEYSIDISP